MRAKRSFDSSIVHCGSRTLVRETVSEKAEFLPPKLALGALSKKLAAAEDLEDPLDIEHVLLQSR